MASPRLAPQIDGFEWRTLLGPTHHWPTPTTNFTNTDQQPISTERCELCGEPVGDGRPFMTDSAGQTPDRKSTRLNSSHSQISYAVFCLKKKKRKDHNRKHEELPV